MYDDDLIDIGKGLIVGGLLAIGASTLIKLSSNYETRQVLTECGKSFMSAKGASTKGSLINSGMKLVTKYISDK